jgi:hypothetical protein
MPDATQIRDIGSASNKFNSIYAGYYYGNGSQLTGISAGNSNSIISGNSNVKIVTAGGNVTIGIGGIGNIVVVSGAGEFVTGVVSASGNITAPYFVGNGSLLTGITTVAAANTAQTVTANAQANITSVGTLTSLSVTGTVQSGNILTSGIVSSTGNITGNYFIGNGSQLTGLAATYGNANVVANLAALGSNPVSTTGNVTGGNLVTGAQVVASGVIQTGTGFSTGGYLSVDGDTDLHKTTVTGNLSATGNITANVSSFFIGNGSQLTGIVSSYGNANVVANLSALGSNPVSTSGNISGNYFIGNGSQLTGLPATYGNSNVATFLAAYGSNTISTTGNITGNYFIGNGSQLTGLAAIYGNANVVANLAALGTNPVSTTGNVTAGYFIGNGNFLTSIAGSNVTGTVANATYAATAGNATSATIAGTVTGNAQANITSVGTLTSLSVSGNTSSGNLLTGGVVSATGNVSGNFFIGNGSQLSSVATQVTGSWTLAAGTNTVSLSVPGPGTYSIWVNGNIPNGIVTYTATIVVTNTNVPVVGSSYGWYYAAGNALVLTSIPNQIVGTENNISTAVVATTTANVFTFGITNNSGSSQVVNYGYTKL